MNAIKVLDNIFWVGAVDWTIPYFHGRTYTTRRGTTYNAYLIMDEKVTLVDTVYAPFTKELLDNISQIVDPSKIDYIIANHVETDHSGALPEVLKRCPNAKVFGTARCKDGLNKNYYLHMDFHVVKTGDTLKLGKRTLSFIEAPMIHWPDSMFTYVVEDGLLLSNDAFGQHFATSGRFDDETDQCALMEETSKYYANILWPLSLIIANKLEEMQKMHIPLKMIAPGHGVIWRQNPSRVVGAYARWAQNESKRKVVVFYETMWGATGKMARKIVEGLASEGVEVKLYDVTVTNHTDIINELLEARGFVAGSSTHDNDMLPSIASLMELLKGLKPKKRLGAVFGSYGWGGGAARELENILKEAGVELVAPPLTVKYTPGEDELQQCYAFGKDFAKKL